MRIAVNTRLLIRDKLEGMGWFAFETLKRITKNHPEHDFYFIFDRDPAEEFIFSNNIYPVIAGPQARHPLLWYMFFEWGLPVAIKRINPDLFMSPDGWLSLKTKAKSHAVIHDINFEVHPEFLPRHIAAYYHYFFPRFARKASRIATVSEFTRKEIALHYAVDTEKIDVVYNGANSDFSPLRDEALIKNIRHTFSGGCPYFLFIGLVHPRKNLANIITAFDMYRKQFNTNHKLLVVGHVHWWTKELKEAYNKAVYKEDIIFAGRLPADDLKKIIPAAEALVYVSFYEGFGIPALEAMYCDVPVIASNRSSLPEVCGDAALYADPYSPEQIANAMAEITHQKELRTRLIITGAEKRKKFSWDNTAALLWQSMEKCLYGE